MSATDKSLPPPTSQAPALLETDGSTRATEFEPSLLETLIPYRGFYRPNQNSPKAQTSAPTPSLFALGQRLRGLFDPRAADFERLLKKLAVQFQTLDAAHERYLSRTKAETEDKKDDPRKDPKHPINASSNDLITEVHFVGRFAMDSSIAKLSTLLIDRDRFGCIVELWLNNNQISDEGASAIASYLERPSCPLVELWLGRNRIGPSGGAAVAAALSGGSRLKCLGLDLNPIGDGGAAALAQMLRGNHALTTVDVHGCLYYEGGDGDDEPGIAEQYAGGCGCKIITPYDGNEYVSQAIASGEIEGAEFVTDRRLVDVIQTFSAFNRRNPTRKEAIRGIELSKRQGVSSDGGNDEVLVYMSDFLSELSNRPANERLTDAEKIRWKECGWKRL